MFKYYLFSSPLEIEKQRFLDALHSLETNIEEITFLSKKSGYLLADEYLADRLETLLPVITSDTGHFFLFLVSYNYNDLVKLAFQKAEEKKFLNLLHLADLVFELALENDFSLVKIATQDLNKIPKYLLMTADAFITSGLNGINAAKKLYIHRNTFLYRLNQFIEITKLDIRDYYNAQYYSLIRKLTKFIEGKR